MPTTWSSATSPPRSMTKAITLYGPRGWKKHEQERLAAVAGQPLARTVRLYRPDPRIYLRDPDGFYQTLRPACRRCTARHGITEPVACHLPSHRTVCRRHLALLQHPWRLAYAVRDATSAIYHALRGGTWFPGQRRMR